MSELNFDEMSQEYFDILRELGNIGAGNATTALAEMLQCKVDMSVPKVGLLTLQGVLCSFWRKIPPDFSYRS